MKAVYISRVLPLVEALKSRAYGPGSSLMVCRDLPGNVAGMKADLVRGHLDALVLATLEGGPLHGYAIIEALFERSDGVLEVPTGSVYPALRRLEEARYVSGRWRVVDGRRRRTYQLTRAGQRALSEQRTEWQRFTAAVHGILGEPAGGSRGGPGTEVDESGGMVGT